MERSSDTEKVLIIEDDRRMAEVISLAFQVYWPEAKLLSARLGREGLELVASESPDVVILDLGLPDIDGFEVLQRVRRFSEVPVMILSAMKDEANIIRALKYGADAYETKPFQHLQMLERVRALIRKKANVKS